MGTAIKRCGGWLTIAAVACVATVWGLADAQEVDHLTVAWEAENYTWMLPHVMVKEVEGASGGHCLTAALEISHEKSGAGYRIQVPREGTYYVWFRGMGVWMGWGRFLVDGTPAGPGIFFDKGPWQWTRGGTEARPPWEASATVELTAGVHTFDLGAPGIGRDGLVYDCGLVDMFLLTTDPDYVPSDDAPVQTTPDIVLPQDAPETLIVVEGEGAADPQGLEVTDLDGAVGGKTLVPVRNAPEVSARLPVSVPTAGEYYVWARTWFSLEQGKTGRCPEVHLRIGEQELALEGGRNWCGRGDMVEYTEYWAWVRDSEYATPHGRVRRGVWTPSPTQFPAGDSVLELVGLNSRTRLDQLAISSDPSWVPAGNGRGPLISER